jgi:CheY-like chemotaxis protein/nitrogen-specific signal transduction histidine kinase
MTFLYTQAKITSNDFFEIIRNSIIIKSKNKGLSIANKNALASSNAKSLFLANMSHEIRTPMNGILSCARFLTEKTADEDSLSLLNTIHKCGDSLLVILNDILDFSKIESGKLVFENSSFNLSQSIDDVIELLKSNASENNVLIKTIVDKDIPTFVIGDVTRFRQVLSNLISNAIKFTSNVVEVHATLVQAKNETYECNFMIIDNGIGISEELLPKLFQNFTQADSSTTRKYGGTGLGLSICRGIVDGLNGKLWAESEENKGSKFFFTLNFKKLDQILSKKNERPSTYENSQLAKQVPLTILIAEDNHINQLVLKRTLRTFGYEEVDIVSNGQEALQAVQEKHYDLIFMDQHMPVMDGIEATRKIRTALGSKIKIFAATASALNEDRDKCLNAGMDTFITKPIKKSDIKEAILSLLTEKELL